MISNNMSLFGSESNSGDLRYLKYLTINDRTAIYMNNLSGDITGFI